MTKFLSPRPKTQALRKKNKLIGTVKRMLVINFE